MYKRAIVGCCIFFIMLGLDHRVCAGELSPQDKQFVALASSGGMYEVRLGEYASQSAASDDVKKFAEHMVGDHAKVNDQLKTLATQEPLEIAKTLNDENKDALARLEKLSGVEFDRAYVAQMVLDHKKDIAAFEKEMGSGSDVSLKGFCEKTLPILKHHLEMAVELGGRLDIPPK
jgi:putative membrane protein